MAAELGARQVRMVYLITYSQVDNSVNVCSSRENFAGKVLSAFRSCGIKVSYWICGREKCQDGGHRYHMSVRLDRSRRWLKVKKNLETEHNMFVNFSSIHVNYYTAYKYVVKEDGQALHSPGHPEVTNCIPKSTAASRKRTGSSTSQSSMEHARKKRPRTFDVSQIVEQHNINIEIQLQTLVIKQEKQDDFPELTINRGAKCVEEAIPESIPDLSSEAVLVQVKASVLSVPDFQVLQELGISQQRIPIGREIAGIVKEVGADVTRFKQGDEVVGVLPLDANCSGCAEFCPVNEYDLAIKPKGVSFTDAAAVIGDAIKSYTALYYQGRICAGETILVTDVKEAGSIAVQLAHHWGAKVIAIAHTEKERSHLGSLKSKIAHVIEMEGQKNFAILNECLEETGGLGVDCVLDSGVNMFPNDLKEGGPAGELRIPHPSKHELISCLAVGGRWITGQKNLQLDPPDSELLYLKGASVHFLNPDVWTLSSAQQGRYLHILHDSMEKLFGGHIRPTIIQRIALDQVPIWYQRASQKTVGKVVVEL